MDTENMSIRRIAIEKEGRLMINKTRRSLPLSQSPLCFFIAEHEASIERGRERMRVRRRTSTVTENLFAIRLLIS